MKTVKYKGQSFQVPDWAKFIASDSDGSVWVFSKYPQTDYDNDTYLRSNNCDNAKHVGQLIDLKYKVKEIK